MSSINTINTAAFYRNNLTEVILSNGIISIGELAFAYNNISNLVIGNNVQTIESFAFGYNNLIDVNISDNVSYLGESAFAYNNLKIVTLGSGITGFGADVFESGISTYFDMTKGPNQLEQVYIRFPKALMELSTALFGWKDNSECDLWSGSVNDNPCITWVNG